MTRLPLTLAVFAVFIGVALLAAFAVYFTPPTFLSLAHAEASPSVAIDLSPSGPVTEGTAIAVTMSFSNLAEDSDRATTDYLFRADVLDADGCEDQAGGYGLGVDRKINLVDEDPEVRRGTISADCPAGDYTVRASISDAGGGELASATAIFSVAAPEPPPSSDAALSGLALSGVTLEFDPATTTYTAEVGNDLAETTVTPTVNDDGATYVVRLDGIADDDGTVPLSVGGNVITIVVTAEDGETSRTYTVTVTRAEAPPELSNDATLSGLALSGVALEFDPATITYTAQVGNDVAETTVTPTVNDDGATYAVRLDGASDDDGTIPLAVGENAISVLVTAEDGETTRTYTVTVTRAEAPPELSNDATLSGLTLSGVTLEFDSDTTGYTSEVGNDLAETTVTPTVNDDGATYAVRLDGSAGDDGTVPLAVGENAISVVVTAEDGETTRTYTVTVTRAEAATSGPTVSIALSPSDTIIEGEGTEIAVTLSFGNLTFDDDRSTTDYVFRADVKDSEDGDAVDIDECEGHDLGKDRYMYQVDEDPETRNATISADCPAGVYTLRASISNADNAELASATAAFYVLPPPTVVEVDDPDTALAAVSSRDITLHSANAGAYGVWSDTTTVWVSDPGDIRLYAYTLADGTRDTSKEFSLASVNGAGAAIWSNGTTIWVSDATDLKFYAYTLAGGARDSGSDFNMALSGTVTPRGIWSNDTTMWLADAQADKLFAYTSGARDTGKDFSLHSDNAQPQGIWSDGTTIWVADSDDDKSYAYTLSNGARVAGKDFDLVAANDAPRGIWSNGMIMWVVDEDDRKLYAYDLPVSSDATLSALTVSPTDIIGFASDVTTYHVGVANSVTQATVTATTNDGNATIAWSATDAGAAAGHQVTLSEGLNTVTITVTAGDGSTEQAYTIHIGRGVTADYGWKASDDFNGLVDAGNTFPLGIWSNGTTMWVMDYTDSNIFAYTRTTKAREPGKEFTTLAAGNTTPRGIWSDSTTMWVADTLADKIFAYNLATKARDPGKDFGTLVAAENRGPQGIWSDGTTMWVTDSGDDKIYAYDLATKERDAGKDFNTLAAGNTDPTGIWSDSATMWVADHVDAKIYAYSVATKARDASKEFNTLTAAGNGEPSGIWSDGETMWVAAFGNKKIYSYNMPPSANANLRELSLSGITLNEDFAAGTTAYTATATAASTTVTATPSHSAAVAVTGPEDADAADGHQVTLADNAVTTITVTVTAQDGATRKVYTVAVTRGSVSSDFGRKATDDFNGLVAAGNTSPFGIWSNDETMWVSDSTDDKIYAYNAMAKTRDTSKDFDTLADAGNTNPTGIWSDGTTMWVVDAGDGKIYAYNLATKERDSDRDFNTLSDAGNTNGYGIWSDGETMWVVDRIDGKIYAYNMATKTRLTDQEFNTLQAAENNLPSGIWSDSVTMWVADNGVDDKIYAYNLATKERDSDRDFNTLSDAGNTNGYGIWSDGETMWATDIFSDKIYAYNMPPPASDDATLSALTVSPTDIIGFAGGTTTYHVGVANSVTQATITATTNNANATIAWSTTDAGTDAGHQVSLSAGLNTVTITVTAEDTTTKKAYTIYVGRGVTADFGWKATDDFNGLTAAGNTFPLGIWSNGATMWVADVGDGKIYAYNLATKERDASKDFNTLNAAGNTAPRGIWSDDATMWVVDATDRKIYAYNLASKARDSGKNFDTLTDAGNTSPNGIWSDGATMWVSDYVDEKIYAYNLATKQWDSGKEFNTLIDAGNTAPAGIWSDDATMWVVDNVDEKIYAYNLATKQRDASKDFNTLNAAGNTGSQGIWSDGATMWVADFGDDKIYSYNMPPSPDANLSALTVSRRPTDIIGFASDVTTYHVGVANSVTQATVTAATNEANATIAWSTTDAGTAAGHQVTLSTGLNTVTITVTAEDTTTKKAYTIFIGRGVTADYGWKATDDFNGVYAAGNGLPRDIWSNGATMWVSDSTDDKIYAYNLATKARDPGKDFNTLADAGNTHAIGIWSDGETMWVADDTDNKIYAYNLATKARDSGKDFNSLADAGNTDAIGIWSDGTTMWVVDNVDDKIYAYNLATKARDSGKEFNTLGAAGNTDAIGIWSNGATMWVSDRTSDKIYAYNLATKTQDSGKEFNTLSDAGNRVPLGIWSDGDTMWVGNVTFSPSFTITDAKLYSYNMPPSPNANLDSISVNGLPVSGVNRADTAYTHTVEFTVRTVIVSAQPAHPGASVTSITPADSDTNAAGHQVALNPDGEAPTDVTITVTAEDGTSTRTYTVRVGWAASGDATLRGLTLSGIPFSFNTATESYTLGGNEGVSLSSTTVTPTVNRPAASYSIDGGAANTPRKVNLAFGANTIAIVVTAADESTAITYVISVNRKAPPPGTPLLRELRLVYQPFVEDTFIGTCPVTVSSSGRCYATPGIHHTEFDVDTGTVDVVTVVANAAAEGASVTFNHPDFDPDKGGRQVKLAGLGTSPTIEVTAANPGGASTVYRINVARQLSGDTRLGELSVTRTGDGTLSDLEPQFITGWNEATGQPRRARYRATLLFNERDGAAENSVVTVGAKELHAGAALRIDGHVTDTNPDRDVFVFALDDSTEQEFRRLELNVKAENADLYVYELVIVKRYSQGDPPPVLAHVFKGLNEWDLKPSLFVDWRDTQSCDKTYNVATEYVTDTQRGWISHPVTSDGEVLNPDGATYTALPQRTHLWLDSESLEVAFGPATAERRDTTIEVWCGPRPYSYKDADGNEQKANGDSREVGTATIEFPDAPPAPPEPTVAPETPTGLAGRLHGNEATLTWDTVAGASGYELSIKVGEDWMLIDPAEFKEKYRLTVVVGEGTATMSPLYDSGFEFRVRAVNDIGASDWSEAATLEY